MVCSKAELFEALRSLDRRLLALEGSLASDREGDGFVLSADGFEASVAIPSSDAVVRTEVELTAIVGELSALGEEHGVAVSIPDDVSASRFDAVATHDALREYTAKLRDAVRGWAGALASAHPELRSAPLTDVAPGEEEEELRRRSTRAAKAFAIAATVVALLATAVWLVSRDQDRQQQLRTAVQTICGRTPPCAGDEPELAVWSRTGLKLRKRYTFVLHRRSADCSRRLEEFFDDRGGYDFRAAPDDPEERELYEWNRGNALRDSTLDRRVTCDDVDELF